MSLMRSVLGRVVTLRGNGGDCDSGQRNVGHKYHSESNGKGFRGAASGRRRVTFRHRESVSTQRERNALSLSVLYVLCPSWPSFRMAGAPAGLAALPLRTILGSYGPFLTHLCSRISPRCRRIMGGFKSKASKKGKMGAAKRWHTPQKLPDDMMRMIFSIYIKKVWPQTEPLSMLLVSKASHGLAVNVLLEMPRPVDRQRLAIPYTEPQCGVCAESFGTARPPTVMLACEAAHLFCWDCIAHHSLTNAIRSADERAMVACPLCRQYSSGLQVCGRAGLIEGARVLLPARVVSFACIRAKQHGRAQRDREETYEAERRDSMAMRELQQALTAACEPVGEWWSTVAAEVALLGGACEAGKLRALAERRGTISAAAVAVSLSLVSAVRDAVLIKCLRSDVRTADVVLRELARRANRGMLRMTHAIVEVAVGRDNGGAVVGEGSSGPSRTLRVRQCTRVQ